MRIGENIVVTMVHPTLWLRGHLTFLVFIVSFMFVFDMSETQGTVVITGELRRWHKVTLTFDGPDTSEDANDPNPFLDYRLNVTFTKGSQQIVVPGYYAADGNAAETSATSGNKWRVHFMPDETGTWTYTTSFRTGTDIAVSLDPNAGSSSMGRRGHLIFKRRTSR